MASRNESPPPNFINEDISFDIIDETAFSKLGFIKLVKKISNKLEEYCDIKSNENFNDNVELDDDLCQLMDMTVEPGVLQFVVDIPLIEPICEAICRNKSNRLNEIFIGILANFASNNQLCIQMSNNPEIVNLIMSFWSSPDSSFLLECVRLLKMVLRNKDCAKIWLLHIKCSEEYLHNIIFILKSSIISELLVSTMQAVTELLSQDEGLCDKWISSELLSAALIARNETDWLMNNDIDYFHYFLLMFSTSEKGVVTLINNVGPIFSGFCDYMDKICDEEPHLITISNFHDGLKWILSTIEAVISNMSDGAALDVIESQPSMLVNLASLVYACSLQFDEPAVEDIYQGIRTFFKRLIEVTHSFLTSNQSEGHNQVKWLTAMNVEPRLPPLQALLACCTGNDTALCKLTEVTLVLDLCLLHEALTKMCVS